MLAKVFLAFLEYVDSEAEFYMMVRDLSRIFAMGDCSKVGKGMV